MVKRLIRLQIIIIIIAFAFQHHMSPPLPQRHDELDEANPVWTNSRYNASYLRLTLPLVKTHSQACDFKIPCMRYVMLLSFMLELFSRHRHSLLMKGIAWLGVGCVCVSLSLTICVYVCINSPCVWVGGDCGDSCVFHIRSVMTWPHKYLKGQRLFSLKTETSLPQFSQIIYLG